MNSPQLQTKLAVYDSLLDGLAELVDQTDQPGEFFHRCEQVASSILGTHWFAIISNGTYDQQFLVHGSQSLSSDVKAALNQQMEHWDERKPCKILDTLVAPLKVGGVCWGWAACHCPDQSASNSDASLEVLEAIAEIIAGMIATNQNKSRQGWHEFWSNANSDLELKRLGPVLVNDVRVLLRTERATLFQVEGNKTRIVATSSVANIENRSQQIRILKSIANWSAKHKEPVFSDQPHPITEWVDSIRHLTDFQFFCCIPITRKPRLNSPVSRQIAQSDKAVIAVLILESDGSMDRVAFSNSMNQMLPILRQSLTHADRFQRIPFRVQLEWLSGLLNFRKLFSLIIGFIFMGMMIACLFWVEQDFKVRIHGEMRPVLEREVYSPEDGLIEQVFVDYRQKVSRGDPLIQLRSSDLEVAIEKNRSQRQQLVQLKEAKKIALSQVSNLQSDPSLAAELASEIADLEYDFAQLELDQKYLERKKQKLLMVSPIDGQITTWKAKEALINKPVKWGEAVIVVAQMDQWQANLYAPEDRIGYLLDHNAKLGSELPVLDLFLESTPADQIRVPIQEIGSHSKDDPIFGRTTLIQCIVPNQFGNKRLGAMVAADVNCGKRSIWFIWTHRLIDSIRRRFVF